MKFTSLAISAYLAYTVSSLPVEAVAPVADAVAPVSNAVASPLWYFYFRRELEEAKRDDTIEKRDEGVAAEEEAVDSPLWYFYFRRALEEVKRDDSSALLYGKGKREDGY